VSGKRIDIVVADGASWTAYDLQMRPGVPASFADDVALLGRLVPSTRLVVALEQRDPGVMVRGGTVAAPASVVLALRAGLGPNMATTSYRVVAMHQEEMPHPVLGAQRLTLRVRTDGSEEEQ
jgi:hypothetical protein